MKNLKTLWIILFGIIIIGCNDETDTITPDPDPDPDPVDPVITINIPTTYTFNRDGNTSVSFSGQSARLEMAKELSSALNNAEKTKAALDSMFNLGLGFDNTALGESGKKIGNKTASSSKASSTVKISFSANWTLPNINPDRKTNEYNNSFNFID
mgnify:CR=1 FL=1